MISTQFMKTALLCMLFSTSLSYAQTKFDKHDALIHDANELRKNGNCKQAIEKYKSALDLLTPNSSTPFFNLAECALKINDTLLAEGWMRSGVAKAGAQMSY
jgi:hypothetical protein